MLNMDRDALSQGKLAVIEPAKWKNQPVSLSQAIKILKEQQVTSIDNFAHIKLFLDKFSAKVFKFIETNQQDTDRMKNQLTRSIEQNKKENAGEIKNARNFSQSKFDNI